MFWLIVDFKKTHFEEKIQPCSQEGDALSFRTWFPICGIGGPTLREGKGGTVAEIIRPNIYLPTFRPDFFAFVRLRYGMASSIAKPRCINFSHLGKTEGGVFTFGYTKEQMTREEIIRRWDPYVNTMAKASFNIRRNCPMGGWFLIFILFPLGFGCSVSIRPHSPLQEENDLRTLCQGIQGGGKMDSLIEWNSSKYVKDNDTMVEFRFRSRYCYYQKKALGSHFVLSSINYYKNSYHKEIYRSDTSAMIVLQDDSRFRVFSSVDRMNVYCCVLNSSDLYIWVYSNGRDIHFRKCILSSSSR